MLRSSFLVAYNSTNTITSLLVMTAILIGGLSSHLSVGTEMAAASSGSADHKAAVPPSFRHLNSIFTVLQAANFYALLPLTLETVAVFDAPLPLPVTASLLMTVAAISAVGAGIWQSSRTSISYRAVFVWCMVYAILANLCAALAEVCNSAYLTAPLLYA